MWWRETGSRDAARHRMFTSVPSPFHRGVIGRSPRLAISGGVTTARDWMLEATKRPALRLLHVSRGGEAALVRLYLEAERHAERAAPWQPMLVSAPRWLRRWLDRHRDEERRHAALFADRLRALGGDTGDDRGEGTRGFDIISRGKLRALHRLIAASAPHFVAGPVVPALAVAWRMEVMGVRVFARHVDVLEQGRPDAALLPVLRAVLADERRHARACRAALDRLVADDERATLSALVTRIDRIERRLGVAGAVVLLVWGGWLWLHDRLASFTSRSPTDAVT